MSTDGYLKQIEMNEVGRGFLKSEWLELTGNFYRAMQQAIFDR